MLTSSLVKSRGRPAGRDLANPRVSIHGIVIAWGEKREGERGGGQDNPKVEVCRRRMCSYGKNSESRGEDGTIGKVPSQWQKIQKEEDLRLGGGQGSIIGDGKGRKEDLSNENYPQGAAENPRKRILTVDGNFSGVG